MKRDARYWRRILVANAAGALAVIVISGGVGPGMRWPAFVRGLATSLVYANCIGLSMAMAMPRIAVSCWERPLRWRWALLISAMIVITAAGTVLASVILLVLGVIPRRYFVQWLIGSFQVAIVISLIIGISVTVYETLRSDLEETTTALRAKERDEAEAQRLAAEAQLASLESRVNPHFLFNTLNSIAELVHRDPHAAERVTGQLASLMRSALDGHSSPLVPLEEELRIVGDYLEIERVRFGDRLRYRLEVPPGVGHALVPRLSLQTLVENSVKYAVSPRREGGSIMVRAALVGDRLRLEVEDDGAGFSGTPLPEGHGLRLLQSRLAMIFGDRASLRIICTGGRTTAKIEIPIEPPSSPQPPATSPHAS